MIAGALLFSVALKRRDPITLGRFVDKEYDFGMSLVASEA
jgi:hypothetical protein